MIPKAPAKKVKRSGTIVHKSFYTAKETINKIKRQTTEGEKLFASENLIKG